MLKDNTPKKLSPKECLACQKKIEDLAARLTKARNAAAYWQREQGNAFSEIIREFEVLGATSVMCSDGSTVVRTKDTKAVYDLYQLMKLKPEIIPAIVSQIDDRVFQKMAEVYPAIAKCRSLMDASEINIVNPGR